MAKTSLSKVKAKGFTPGRSLFTGAKKPSNYYASLPAGMQHVAKNRLVPAYFKGMLSAAQLTLGLPAEKLADPMSITDKDAESMIATAIQLKEAVPRVQAFSRAIAEAGVHQAEITEAVTEAGASLGESAKKSHAAISKADLQAANTLSSMAIDRAKYMQDMYAMGLERRDQFDRNKQSFGDKVAQILMGRQKWEQSRREGLIKRDTSQVESQLNAQKQAIAAFAAGKGDVYSAQQAYGKIPTLNKQMDAAMAGRGDNAKRASRGEGFFNSVARAWK